MVQIRSKLGSFIESARDPMMGSWTPRVGSMVLAWHRGHRLRDIAAVHGVTAERIREILQKAQRQASQRADSVTSEDVPERVSRAWEDIMSRTHG